MNKSDKTILVTGATGKQGGAVANCLLKDGWRVRIFTREPGKAVARELANQGATISKGDLNDRNSLESAMNGCYGCFSVQDAMQGPENEVRQGKLVVDVAASSGLRQLVYASVCAANKNTGIPFFESKWQIEQYLQSKRTPWTVLRPVFFMENFWAYQKDNVLNNGKISLPLRADKALQMIAVGDIGAFAAICFNDPDANNGKAFDLAGDELTLTQAARQIGQTIGRDVTYEQTPIEQMRRDMPAMATMYEWFNNVGYQVDIKSLRKTFSRLQNFQNWLKQSQWAKAQVASGR